MRASAPRRFVQEGVEIAERARGRRGDADGADHAEQIAEGHVARQRCEGRRSYSTPASATPPMISNSGTVRARLCASFIAILRRSSNARVGARGFAFLEAVGLHEARRAEAFREQRRKRARAAPARLRSARARGLAMALQRRRRPAAKTTATSSVSTQSNQSIERNGADERQRIADERLAAAHQAFADDVDVVGEARDELAGLFAGDGGRNRRPSAWRTSRSADRAALSARALATCTACAHIASARTTSRRSPATRRQRDGVEIARWDRVGRVFQDQRVGDARRRHRAPARARAPRCRACSARRNRARAVPMRRRRASCADHMLVARASVSGSSRRWAWMMK